ncbi:MAG: hypothetical protein II991_06435 [Bacteroidales bacterium]|nr:hypothetical protein [Bacteroidales bacterium]
MMKNMIYRFALVSAALISTLACVQEEKVAFEVDTDQIEVGPDGGVEIVGISSGDRWRATVQVPWITVSPANGSGSVECSIIVDSALTATAREAVVRIENQVTGDRKDFKVTQQGFEYQIVPDEKTMALASYASLSDRKFNVTVRTNVPFKVVIPDDSKKWLSCEMPLAGLDENDPKDKKKIDEWWNSKLDRGGRPRNISIPFEWGVNFNPEDRSAVVKFNPVDPAMTPSIKDDLTISQDAADEIEIGVKGDSLAIIAIHQALGCWTELDTSEKMEFWDGVEVWQSGENKGRVKRVEFYMFGTKEGIPFQIKYLNAAEEIYIYGNTNTFLLSLDPGEHICELVNLRKLTIGAYGLSTLPDSFKKLRNLEYLDISSNNFQKVPEVLTPENFPKLTALIMNSCVRNTIYDLSNTNKTGFGGLFEESDVDEAGKKSFPKRLLMWDNLDTLRLSVNYLEGTIPDLTDDTAFPKWTAEEVNACDTLPSVLIGLPKVLPDTDLFAINLNRLHGNIPDWLLYHPKLDLWYPTSLVFMQEGKTSYGQSAGFENEPANMDYYYEHYRNKKYNPANIKSEDNEYEE